MFLSLLHWDSIDGYPHLFDQVVLQVEFHHGFIVVPLIYEFGFEHEIHQLLTRLIDGFWLALQGRAFTTLEFDSEYFVVAFVETFLDIAEYVEVFIFEWKYCQILIKKGPLVVLLNLNERIFGWYWASENH